MWRSGSARALITLVRVQGSSYRKVGARLMIDQHGNYVGSISGGCLEADLLRKAHWLIKDGASMVRYSTEFDDTDAIPFGLGCGGTLDLLVEPAGTREFDLLMTTLERSLRGDSAEMITILPSDSRHFQRFLVEPFGLRSTLEDDTCFLEQVEPPPRVLILGAGDDAQPLVKLAALLGWRVVVFDGRTQWAKASRFPDAERVLHLDLRDAADLDVGERDLVILMSHSYSQDRDWLRYILPRRPLYLALLGARQRSFKIVTEASEILGWSLHEVAKGVATPAGLDLGGDGPVAIALAIVSEMQACLNGRALRSRPPLLKSSEPVEEGADVSRVFCPAWSSSDV
ncbi:XdhC family protein [Acidisarcina polymorpha]